MRAWRPTDRTPAQLAEAERQRPYTWTEFGMIWLGPPGVSVRGYPSGLGWEALELGAFGAAAGRATGPNSNRRYGPLEDSRPEGPKGKTPNAFVSMHRPEPGSPPPVRRVSPSREVCKPGDFVTNPRYKNDPRNDDYKRDMSDLVNFMIDDAMPEREAAGEVIARYFYHIRKERAVSRDGYDKPMIPYDMIDLASYRAETARLFAEARGGRVPGYDAEEKELPLMFHGRQIGHLNEQGAIWLYDASGEGFRAHRGITASEILVATTKGCNELQDGGGIGEASRYVNLQPFLKGSAGAANTLRHYFYGARYRQPWKEVPDADFFAALSFIPVNNPKFKHKYWTFFDAPAPPRPDTPTP